MTAAHPTRTAVPAAEDSLLARIDAMLTRLDRVTQGEANDLFRDCRAALAERIPREPTALMAKAGEEADVTVEGPLVSRREAATIWRAMYDAAVPGIPRERDAERYRWLRDNDGSVIYDGHIHALLNDRRYGYEPADLDDLIDAALAKESESSIPQSQAEGEKP